MERHVAVVAELAEGDAQRVGAANAHRGVGFELGELVGAHVSSSTQCWRLSAGAATPFHTGSTVANAARYEVAGMVYRHPVTRAVTGAMATRLVAAGVPSSYAADARAQG